MSKKWASMPDLKAKRQNSKSKMLLQQQKQVINCLKNIYIKHIMGNLFSRSLFWRRRRLS